MGLQIAKKKTKVTIELPCGADEAKQVVADLMTVTQKLKAEEISLLAKAVKNPLIKKQALSKLKEILG